MALCESAMGQHPNTCVPWNVNKGPFQIWRGHLPALAEHGITDLCDVGQNVRAAHILSAGGANWSLWSCRP